jgi:hypothetical protein
VVKINKKKAKLVVMLVPLLIGISMLSGCVAVNAIQTKHWDHINSEGTGVRLWGFLVLGENFHNWDGYFVYDTEKHDNWEHYQYRVEADNYDSFNFFSVDIYGLDRTTEYHYRAVGEKKVQGSTIRVGIDSTFIPGGPRVDVKAVSDIGLNSAVLEGELTHMGGAESCEVFFRYGTDQNNLNLETTHQTMTSTGNFNFEITGLTSCQKYFYRAIAINDADTWASLFALAVTPGMPIVETYLPNEVTSTSAKFRGELFALGGPSSCDVWFEYGNKNPNQLDETTDPITLTAPGQFNTVCDVLNPGTTYWVRAVASNGVCEHKGQIKEFRTTGFGDSSNSKNIVIQQQSQNHLRNIIQRLFDKIYEVLGIPKDTPKELLIDSYPILAPLLRYLE